ncbi:hypothetical protein SPRG_20127, partial [Saprolegnia parasitica CBS 223.65]
STRSADGGKIYAILICKPHVDAAPTPTLVVTIAASVRACYSAWRRLRWQSLMPSIATLST